MAVMLVAVVVERAHFVTDVVEAQVHFLQRPVDFQSLRHFCRTAVAEIVLVEVEILDGRVGLMGGHARVRSSKRSGAW